MSRIRNVKPEFFRHEDLQGLESKYPKNRVMLTFSGLWTLCDRKGVFQYKPNQIHLDVLPFVKFDIEGTLNILVSAGYIHRFSINGNEYGYIPTFRKHQAISGKELACKFQYPEPPENIPEHAEKVPEQSTPVPDEFQASSTPVPDRPDFMTSLRRDLETSDNTHKSARDHSQLPATMDTELFETIQAVFLSQGTFTDPGGEVVAIRKIMGYAQNNPGDIEIMLETYLGLTKGDDKFWTRQPFLPSALSNPRIWDRVKLEARKKLEAPEDRAAEWDKVFREVAEKKANECVN